jgi:hypothetical protein
MSNAPYLAKHYEELIHQFDPEVRFLINNCMNLADSFMAMHYYAAMYLNVQQVESQGFEEFYYTEIPEEHDLKRTFVMAIMFAMEGYIPQPNDACIDFNKVRDL